MAEAAISMLLTRLAPIIEKKVREEVSLFLNTNIEATKLSVKLKKIQEVLMDAEQKRVIDPKIQSWLQKLQDISYDVGDVLDEWDVANLRKQLEALEDANSDESSWMNKVSSFLESVCLCFKQSLEHRSIALNMKQLNERLDSVAEENEKEFKFIPNLNHPSQGVKRNISTSFVDISEVEGRDGDREMLMKMLLPQPQLPNSSSSSREDAGTKIVSIVGAGGMGKTTLAQLVYNDDDHIVKRHFDIKIWVCVSDPFDEIKIAKAILEALTKSSSNVSNNIETLLQSVKESISGKRFLLVLDDVWTEDDTMWKPMKICLIKNGGPGSRILVTTRSRKVGEAMGSTRNQIHSLDPLSDSYCWSILSKLAFHERNEGDCEMLKDIGWEIALKCKGLPLAAKTLGSLLRFKNSHQEWEAVLKSEILELEKMRTDLFPILALSYNELHPEVKRCFSYCAIFPKDHVFYVEELIKIWIANGFISSSSSTGTGSVGENIEQKGVYYFENLAMHSFFQDFERQEYPSNSIVKCKMHDIIHDFAQFLLGKNLRHLYLEKFEGNNMSVQDIYLRYELENLHSLFCTENEIAQGLLIYLKRVRSLSLSGCKLEVIPEEIGNLIHLRYLDLSWNDYMSKLPETICDLYNLQTLDIAHCSGLHGLPQGIHKLKNLRHLLNRGTSDSFEFPRGFETLTNLQTLGEITFGGKNKHKLGYLKDMNQLRGSLLIWIYDDDNEVEAELKSKKSIQQLIIHLGEYVGLKTIDALQPSPNLLTLNYYGSYLPNWMASLTNLRKLIIGNLMADYVDLSSLRNLSFLEDLSFLRIEMTHLSFGITNASGRGETAKLFPKLKKLKFVECQKWTEWEDIRGDEYHNILPFLEELELTMCWDLKALPHRLLHKLSSLQKLIIIDSCRYLEERYSEGIGQDWHQISHIPFINISSYL